MWTHTTASQRVEAGTGVATDATRWRSLLRELGVRRLLLVTTPGRLASEEGEAVRRAIGPAAGATCAEVRAGLPSSSVQAVLVALRDTEPDGVVSFGGGAAIDAAKAATFFHERQRGTPGASFFDRPLLPHVAVPTTYVGAELTARFAVVDEHTHARSEGGSPTTVPAVVLRDAALTCTTPVVLTAASALAALSHAAWAVVAPGVSPEAEALALAGAQRIASVLPLVVDTPDDLVVRADLSTGAHLAGRALQHAGPGPVHRVAGVLAARAPIGYSLALALLLGSALRRYRDLNPVGLSRFADALGADDPADAASELVARVGLPDGLGAAGAGTADRPAVARVAASIVQGGPLPLDEAAVEDLLDDAW